MLDNSLFTFNHCHHKKLVFYTSVCSCKNADHKSNYRQYLQGCAMKGVIYSQSTLGFFGVACGLQYSVSTHSYKAHLLKEPLIRECNIATEPIKLTFI